MSAVAAAAPQRRAISSYAWPLGFLTAAVLIFVFYQFIFNNLSDSAASYFQDWFSMSAINEAVIYVIMALGLNVVVGYAGLLDLGYVAFWAIGSYVGAWLMSAFWDQVSIHFGSAATVQNLPGIHINFWLVLVIAAIVCAIMGSLIGAPTLRLRSDYLALVTLGFGEIIPQFFTNGDNIAGFNLTNGTKGITPIDPIPVPLLNKIQGVPNELTAGQNSLPFKFLIFAFLAAICVFVSLRIRSGRLGRSWLALREDELAASMMGVTTVRAKLSAYSVGAFFGGLGGVAYATHVNAAIPDSFSFAKSITVLIMVVLGGMGNVWGVMIGAFVLAWINNTGLSQFGQWFNGQFNTNINFPAYNFLIFGVILVLMMLFRREGLIPERRTQQILREPARTEAEALGSEVETVEAADEAVSFAGERVEVGSIAAGVRDAPDSEGPSS
jgi:branched-chain amino acid transport system permease protein